MKTRISKGFHGWTADTSVPLDDTRQLRFTTMKRSNGAISTTCQCGESDGSFFKYVMFQDFNMRVLSEPGRATEKFIADQHQRALALVDEIKRVCKAHYSKETA